MSRRSPLARIVTLAAVTGALALAGTAAAHPVSIGRYAEIPYGIRADHPAPTERGDPRRTGRLRHRAPAEMPTRLWSVNLRHRRPRGPTLSAEGGIYLGTMGGLMSMAPDGSERWTLAIGAVHAAPSLAPSGDIVVVTRAGSVVLATPEGVLRQVRDLGAPARGSPLVLDDGSILVGTIDRRVHRLDANLRPVFEATLSDGSSGTVSRTRRGEMAIAAGRLLTILTPEGGLLHQVNLGGRATAPGAVGDDGTIWVPTVEGMLHAIESDGRVRSRTDLGSRHYDGAAPAIGHDGAVRVPTMTEGVICVGPGGTERWRQPNSAGYNAPATIDPDDTTLVVDRQGRLIALAADGTERWRVVLGSFSFSEPVVGADGTVYVTTERGALLAYR